MKRSPPPAAWRGRCFEAEPTESSSSYLVRSTDVPAHPRTRGRAICREDPPMAARKARPLDRAVSAWNGHRRPTIYAALNGRGDELPATASARRIQAGRDRVTSPRAPAHGPNVQYPAHSAKCRPRAQLESPVLRLPACRCPQSSCLSIAKLIAQGQLDGRSLRAPITTCSSPRCPIWKGLHAIQRPPAAKDQMPTTTIPQLPT